MNKLNRALVADFRQPTKVKYFATSTGAVYIIDDDSLSKRSQLPNCLRVASGPIRAISVFTQGNEIIIVTTTDHSLSGKCSNFQVHFLEIQASERMDFGISRNPVSSSLCLQKIKFELSAEVLEH